METNYYFNKIVSGSFDNAVQRVTTLLQEEGFGILTEINLHETFKKKLNLNFKKYKILGACNPDFAYKALTEEDKVGTMLPCNIIVQEIAPNSIEIAAVNPIASMQAIKNLKLGTIANEVSGKLKRVIKKL